MDLLFTIDSILFSRVSLYLLFIRVYVLNMPSTNLIMLYMRVETKKWQCSKTRSWSRTHKSYLLVAQIFSQTDYHYLIYFCEELTKFARCNFRLSHYPASLIIAIKPRAEEYFSSATTLPFYIMKKNCLNKSWISFWYLLLYTNFRTPK